MNNYFLSFLSVAVGMFSCLSDSLAQEYFQQDVKYDIKVVLNDKTNELSGHIRIDYKNNSPANLDFIYIHLWPNAYKNNNTALAQQFREDGELKFERATAEQRGFIDSLNFSVNGQKAKFEHDSLHIDFGKIILESPLKPAQSLTISTPFHVKIPEGIFSRLGHMGQSYQITQWYPKPAVLDKNGWHPLPYLNQGEFYSEFGSYNVSITLPKNYVVGATGDLINSDTEVEWLNNKAKETKELFSKEDTDKPSLSSKPDMSFPPSDTSFKTLQFVQKDVHDFAWFADKRYHVLKSEVELPYSKRKVTTWAMFTNSEKELWKKSCAYINDAIYYYSKWVGEYPYNHATAVDGALSAGGGMEYPNITVIGKSGSAYLLDVVIAHEVGHNWFYGLLGSNERQHAWMDEGINSFYENRLMRQKYPPENGKAKISIGGLGFVSDLIGLDGFDNSSLLELAYRMNARRRLDQPIEDLAIDYTQINYGAIVYEKTAIVFDYLKEYLGDEKFDACMKRYFDSWKFKHPQPEDLRKIFTENTDKNLDWFFDDLIRTSKPIDYKIISAKKTSCETDSKNDCWKVKIKNVGKVNSPFSLSSVSDENKIQTTWYAGFSGKQDFNFNSSSFEKLVIDYEKKMPDLNRKNNTLKGKGLCKRTEPFQLKLLGGVENPERTQVYFFPVAGWNYYDKTLAGIAFYNSVIPSKKFEYVIVPMYGFGSKTLNGLSDIRYNFYPSGDVFQNIYAGFSFKKFSENNYPVTTGFHKIAPEINFTFRKPEPRSKVNQSIRIRNVNIENERAVFSYLENKHVSYFDSYYVNEISYSFENNRKLSPYSWLISMQQGDGFFKGIVTAAYNVSFNKKTKGIDLRFFSGKFFSNDLNNNVGFSLDGNNDYMYDAVFLGRNEMQGFLSQQFLLRDGGFKNHYNSPLASDWLTAVNMKLSTPWKLPIRLYADAGVSDKSTVLEYDAGIVFTPVPEIIEIYFPLAMAQDLHFKKYGEKIRFTFNIQLLNPFELIKKSTQ